MSKLFDNKQLLHVVAEVVILLSLTYNISSKFKTVRSYIDDICHRLDEQEEIIETQNKKIETLTNEVKTLNFKFNMLQGLPAPISKPLKSQDKKLNSKSASPHTPPTPKPTPKPTPTSSPMTNSINTAPIPDNSPSPSEDKKNVSERKGTTHFEESNIFSSITFIPMMNRTTNETPAVEVEELEDEEKLDAEILDELNELDDK